MIVKVSIYICAVYIPVSTFKPQWHVATMAATQGTCNDPWATHPEVWTAAAVPTASFGSPWRRDARAEKHEVVGGISGGTSAVVARVGWFS